MLYALMYELVSNCIILYCIQAIRDNLAAAQRAVSAGGSEQDVANAKIEVEVLEALQAAVGKSA